MEFTLSFGLVGFDPGFCLISLAVEAPLAVPFGTGSFLLLFKGSVFVDVAGFILLVDGGGEEGKFTGFTASLTGSGLGLFVNVVDFVVAGFGGSLLLGGTVAVFLMVSGFSAGFLG